MRRIDPKQIGEIADDLARDTEGFCQHFFPCGRKTGNYWQMGDVTGVAGKSLSIRLRSVGGRAAGKWTDHATGEYGDLLDLLRARLDPVDWPDLLKLATDFLGQTPLETYKPRETHQRRRPSNNRAEAGRRLFGYGKPVSGTLAETYLVSRDITRRDPTLRFHPSAYLLTETGQRMAYPALLASITDNSSKVTGCSRIFLDPLGGLAKIEAPKRVLGELHGNGIRFGPWQQARDLIIGEGLENTLSVGMAFPTAALVSCLTANHMAAFVWPSSVRRLWIAHDNDVAGLRGAKNLKSRFEAAQGQAVLLCPIRDDFNLDLIAEGVTALRHRLSALISEQITGHDLWPDEQAA